MIVHISFTACDFRNRMWHVVVVVKFLVFKSMHVVVFYRKQVYKKHEAEIRQKLRNN